MVYVSSYLFEIYLKKEHMVWLHEFKFKND